MTTTTERHREPWAIALLTGALVLGGAALALAWGWRDAWLPVASEALPTLWETLRATPPLIFFGALVVLPALPIPISPF
jgi:hypothetical protein